MVLLSWASQVRDAAEVEAMPAQATVSGRMFFELLVPLGLVRCLRLEEILD